MSLPPLFLRGGFHNPSTSQLFLECRASDKDVYLIIIAEWPGAVQMVAELFGDPG